MYTSKKTTRKFDTDDKEDMAEYDAILNDPLCSIIDKWKEKITYSEYDKGKIVSSEQHLYIVVTWEQRSLA